MTSFELIRTLRTFGSHRLRAALTLLGIILGSGSIVFLAGMLHAAKAALLSADQEARDSDLVSVSHQDLPPGMAKKSQRELSRMDAESLASVDGLAGAVGTESQREQQASFQGRKKRVRIVSGDETSAALYRLEVSVGRFLDAEDVRGRRRVAVVGQEIWSELIAKDGPVELPCSLPIEGEVWSVVGVLKHKPFVGETSGTEIWDRRLLVPVTTFDALFAPAHTVDRILFRTTEKKGEGEAKALLRGVEEVLLRRHLGLKNFKIDSDQSNEQAGAILIIVQVLLFSTSLLSLFVAGVNIMNIMMVTVSERIREIGVRRAVGASPKDIRNQFLAEAAIVTSLGGLLGVVAAVILLAVLAFAMSQVLPTWPFWVEPWSIAAGVGLSAATGIIFGLMPARKAARMDPIEALRVE